MSLLRLTIIEWVRNDNAQYHHHHHHRFSDNVKIICATYTTKRNKRVEKERKKCLPYLILSENTCRVCRPTSFFIKRFCSFFFPSCSLYTQESKTDGSHIVLCLFFKVRSKRRKNRVRFDNYHMIISLMDRKKEGKKNSKFSFVISYESKLSWWEEITCFILSLSFSLSLSLSRSYQQVCIVQKMKINRDVLLMFFLINFVPKEGRCHFIRLHIFYLLS